MRPGGRHKGEQSLHSVPNSKYSRDAVCLEEKGGRGGEEEEIALSPLTCLLKTAAAK